MGGLARDGGGVQGEQPHFYFHKSRVSVIVRKHADLGRLWRIIQNLADIVGQFNRCHCHAKPAVMNLPSNVDLSLRSKHAFRDFDTQPEF